MLLSRGHWRRLTKLYASFPHGAFVCTSAPLICVRTLHKELVDLAISLVYGRLVFAWHRLVGSCTCQDC